MTDELDAINKKKQAVQQIVDTLLSEDLGTIPRVKR